MKLNTTKSLVCAGQVAEARCGHKVLADDKVVRINHYYGAALPYLQENMDGGLRLARALILAEWQESRGVYDDSAVKASVGLEAAIRERGLGDIAYDTGEP